MKNSKKINNLDQQSNIFTTISNIYFVIIFIVFIVLLTIYCSTLPDQIINNNDSTSRMVRLDQVLTSLLGKNWRTIFVIFIIIFIIILYLLYVLAQDGHGINITMSDQSYKIFFWILITLIVLYTIYIITLVIKTYSENKKTQQNEIKNFKPDENKSNNKTQILEIIGLSLFILVALGVGLYFLLRHRNNKNK